MLFVKWKIRDSKKISPGRGKGIPFFRNFLYNSFIQTGACLAIK